MLKVTLLFALLGSTLMADDGQMGSGGRSCPPEGCPPPPCTENCGRPAEIGTDKETGLKERVFTTAITLFGRLVFRF